MLPVNIQSPVASSEHLCTLCLAVGRRLHGYYKSLEINKEDLKANVINSNIYQPTVLVYLQLGIGQLCRARHFI
jgi:hypothetical protein